MISLARSLSYLLSCISTRFFGCSVSEYSKTSPKTSDLYHIVKLVESFSPIAHIFPIDSSLLSLKENDS